MLARRETSSEDLTRAHLDQIARVDGEVHAFLAILEGQALAQARAVDARRAAGEELGPLAGIPLALKDILCTKGIPTTCGSKILQSYRPPYDATVVEKLRGAGAIVVGKANMDEFAMGSSTENSAFGPTHNPWDLATVPGGSSGGSAAAVAAREAVLGIGTDTGGSIRQPAALCGVVGVKPTYGMVSRFGLIAFASSLDQVGPFARNVRDAALLLEAIAGHDPRDSTSIPRPAPDLVSGLEGGVVGMRLGVVKELMGEGFQPGVLARLREALDRFERLGAVVSEVSLPTFDTALSAYYLIAPAECSSNLARYDGVRYGYRTPDSRDIVDMNSRTRGEGFGPEVKRRIMLGSYALSAGYYDAYYGQAQKVRTLIARDFERTYEKVDLLISPTSPTTAFRLGEKAEDPLAMYMSDVCTIPTNLAGAAAMSLPCGVSPDDGLPVGLHIMARPLDEARMLQAAYAFEQDLGWQEVPPGARLRPGG
ncbi:MAG: Asp-tRNA(Asn)/Glu-tRNA(Gln) amidotransferase subunit GatA [Actinomycetota bacterium]